jgi:hypothetical protein
MYNLLPIWMYLSSRTLILMCLASTSVLFWLYWLLGWSIPLYPHRSDIQNDALIEWWCNLCVIFFPQGDTYRVCYFLVDAFRLTIGYHELTLNRSLFWTIGLHLTHLSIFYDSISSDICHSKLGEILLLQVFPKYKHCQKQTDLFDKDPPM